MGLTLEDIRQEQELSLQLRKAIYSYRAGGLSDQHQTAMQSRIESLSEDYIGLTGKYFRVEYPLVHNED